MATDSDGREPERADSEAWTAVLPATNWRPPRAGSALAVVLVAVACWLLADALGILDSLAVAAGGAAGLAGVVWLLGRERFAAVGTLLGVTVAPLAGGLLLAGVGYVAIAQLAGFAPQGAVFVALGVALAAFGAAAIPGDSADREHIAVAARRTVVAAVLLVAVAGGLAGDAVRREEEIEPFGGLTLPELPSLFPETLGVPPLGSFLLVVSLSLLALRGALTALPIAELLDDRTAGDDAVLGRFERLLAVLNYASIGVVAGTLVVVARILLGPAYLELWAVLPSTAVDLVAGLVAAEPIRWLAVRVLVLGAGVVAGVRIVRRLHRSELRAHAGTAALLVGVGITLAAGWFGHGAIVNAVLTRLEAALPGAVAEVVLEQVGSVIEYYGGEVVALGLVAVGGAVGAFTLAALRLGTLLRIVPRSHSGPALASAGLLATGGFAAALGAPIRYAIGAIVGAVVVWDLGRFGVSLGRDVGRRAPSRPVQFLRVLAAASVGAVTAALGLAAASLTASVSLATESAAALALFVAVGVAFLASLALAR